jgi:hypothetical protein
MKYKTGRNTLREYSSVWLDVFRNSTEVLGEESGF